jgi:hypothetical protein
MALRITTDRLIKLKWTFEILQKGLLDLKYLKQFFLEIATRTIFFSCRNLIFELSPKILTSITHFFMLSSSVTFIFFHLQQTCFLTEN